MPLAATSANRLADMFNLKGKIVVVTGASGPTGIGLEVARGCAEMRADIAITYFSRPESSQKNADDIAKEYGIRAKAGCIHLAKSLANEWRGFARVNSVSPGYIDTGLSGFIPTETRKLWHSLLTHPTRPRWGAKGVEGHLRLPGE